MSDPVSCYYFIKIFKHVVQRIGREWDRKLEGFHARQHLHEAVRELLRQQIYIIHSIAITEETLHLNAESREILVIS